MNNQSFDNTDNKAMDSGTKCLVVMLATGVEDGGKRATLAFSAACTSQAMGTQTQVFLVGSGAHWGYEGHANSVTQNGFPPLGELMADFIDVGGQIYICSTCDKVCAVPDELGTPSLMRRTEVHPRGFATVLSDVMGSSSVTF